MRPVRSRAWPKARPSVSLQRTPPPASSRVPSARSSSLASLLDRTGHARRVRLMPSGGPRATIQMSSQRSVAEAVGRDPGALTCAYVPTGKAPLSGPCPESHYVNRPGRETNPTSRRPTPHESRPRDINDPRRGGGRPGRRPSSQRRPGGCSPARNRAGLAPGPLQLRPRRVRPASIRLLSRLAKK